MPSEKKRGGAVEKLIENIVEGTHDVAAAISRRERRAALEARFASRDPREIERALADIGLTCGEYQPCETGDPILHHLLPEMLARLEVDADAAWQDAKLMQRLRGICLRCPPDGRKRCRIWLKSEDAGDGYRDFCPNAEALDSLPRKEK